MTPCISCKCWTFSQKVTAVTSLLPLLWSSQSENYWLVRLPYSSLWTSSKACLMKLELFPTDLGFIWVTRREVKTSRNCPRWSDLLLLEKIRLHGHWGSLNWIHLIYSPIMYVVSPVNMSHLSRLCVDTYPHKTFCLHKLDTWRSPKKQLLL